MDGLFKTLVHPRAADSLDEEEEDPAAIQRRDRQDIQEREVDGKYARKLKEVDKAETT